MKNLLVKDFIFWTPSSIQGLAPLRKAKNEYGVVCYFYLINNANIGLLKAPFSCDFKEQKEIEEFRKNYSIVDKKFVEGLIQKFKMKQNEKY